MEDVELSIAASSTLILLFNAVSTKIYIFCKVRVHFYRHRDIISFSGGLSSTMSVPPVTSSLQVSQLDSAQVPDALTSGSTANVSSSGSVLPTSYLVRDPEQIAASDTRLCLSSMKGQEPSSLIPCWLKTFLRSKTYLRHRMRDVPRPSNVSQDFEVIIPCKTLAVDRDARPYPRLVDPAAITLPLQFTPMDDKHWACKVYLDLEHSTFHQSLETCHT